METLSYWLGVSQVIVGALAVAVVFIGYMEYIKVRELRKDLETFKSDVEHRMYTAQKSQQRILASYSVTDIDQKIALLKSAVEIDPGSFNGYNALGYAFLSKNDEHAALAAFQQATIRHPEAKEGWFDLAGVYHGMKRFDLARDCIGKAISVDPTARADALADPRFNSFA